MNIPILFSLIDPELVLDRYSSIDVLVRISRIHEAARIHAVRKDLDHISDPFLERIGQPIDDLCDWEINAGGNILYHVWRKLKRLDPMFELPGFGSGFQQGLLDTSKALGKYFEEDHWSLLCKDHDSYIREVYQEFEEYINNMYVSPLVEFDTASERDRWSKGYQAGINLFQNPDGTFPGETLATKRNAAMIFLYPEISELKTVSEIFEFLKNLGCISLPKDLESFKVYCSNLGLRGRDYRRS